MEFETSWAQTGRAEGPRELVEWLLIRKLGSRSDDVLARLAPLFSAQRTALGEALLDFTAPGDLAAWLGAPPPPQDDEAAPAIS